MHQSYLLTSLFTEMPAVIASIVKAFLIKMKQIWIVFLAT